MSDAERIETLTVALRGLLEATNYVRPLWGAICIKRPKFLNMARDAVDAVKNYHEAARFMKARDVAKAALANKEA